MIFYFGCWDRVGHGLYDEQGRGVWEYPFAGSGGGRLDGPFTPHRAKTEGPEGVARLTVVDGHTILSFRDNSVDSRGGSHSTFIVEGDVSYEEMLDQARATFPHVFDRLEARGINVVREAQVT